MKCLENGTLFIESAYYGIHDRKSSRDCCEHDPSLICHALHWPSNDYKNDVKEKVIDYCEDHGIQNKLGTLNECKVPASEGLWNNGRKQFTKHLLWAFWPSLKIAFRCEDAETGIAQKPFRTLGAKE